MREASSTSCWCPTTPSVKSTASSAGSTTSEVQRIARWAALVTSGAALTAPLWLQREVTSTTVALYPACAFLLLAGARLAVRGLGRLARRRSRGSRRFAVVGRGELAREVLERFATHPEWGYTFAGYVVEDATRPGDDCHVLGRVAELGALLRAQVIDEVVFAVPTERLASVQAAARLCEQQGIGVRVYLDLLRGGIARPVKGDLGGLPVLAYSTGPRGPALDLKRLFDIAVSSAALILLAPILAAVALAIWCESPGKVLFRQRRVGLNGRDFDLFKFRSMHRDAESQLPGLRTLNEATGPVFKMRRDPRVTSVGRFIRRTSLDELPQFWNVLLGEMSIVGPRPALPAEVRQYEAWQRRRLSVRPGITCTWQISGRSEIAFDRWMQLDLEYIDHWSLLGDLRIFARTIPAVVTARGAR